MLKVERGEVLNMHNAMRGARNPLNSWDRSDSYVDNKGNFILGANDRSLALRLCNAGSDHRKFIRQILVSVDITAPLYWWKEFDTYKVGTVANSTSTMHKIHANPLTLADFSIDRMTGESLTRFESYVNYLEEVRSRFVATGDRMWWNDLIQLLPSSYNQMRTVTMNYENLRNMYASRKNHKLQEWHTLCDWIVSLPYADVMITGQAE